MKGHGILGYINSQRNPETDMYRLWVSDLLFSTQYGCLMLVHHVKVVVWSGCVCVSHFQTPTWIDWYGTMGVWVNSVLIWLYMIIDRYVFPKLSKLRFVTHSFNNPFPPKKNTAQCHHGGMSEDETTNGTKKAMGMWLIEWGWHYIYPGWWFGTWILWLSINFHILRIIIPTDYIPSGNLT